MRERLLTRDKLLRWGLLVSEECLLCDNASETCPHLFFFCPFSSQIYNGLLSHHTFNLPDNLVEAVSWVKGASTSKRVIIISKMVLQTIVYEVWKERNTRLHSSIAISINIIIKEIQFTIRKKLYTMDQQERGAHVPSHDDSFLSLWFSFFLFILTLQFLLVRLCPELFLLLFLLCSKGLLPSPFVEGLQRSSVSIASSF